MTESQKRIEEILAQIEMLRKRQEDFFDTLNVLQAELEVLRDERETDENKASYEADQIELSEPVIVFPAVADEISDAPKELEEEKIYAFSENKQENTLKNITSSGKTSDWERFIGENLISKIGIAATIIGVGLGTKYSIDNNLISPLTRIVLGYVAGIALFVLGFRVRKKYENFSAVLVSGAIAACYMITFSASVFYDFIPRAIAFPMMVVFTGGAVYTALDYNKVVIAHFGLVAAYAVPFLLSNESGNTLLLFSYVLLINLGILFLAYKRLWYSIRYTSFFFTWLIFLSMYALGNASKTLFLSFIIVFFLLFLFMFIINKVKNNKAFNGPDVALILVNSALFFFVGFDITETIHETVSFSGLFAVSIALIYFLTARIFFNKEHADKAVERFFYGLSLVFVTLAIPIQFDENIVTLLWLLQAAVLFYVGRVGAKAFYEFFGLSALLLASVSLIIDWNEHYDAFYSPDIIFKWPFLNFHFITCLAGAVVFLSLYRINRKDFNGNSFLILDAKRFTDTLEYLFPICAVGLIYFSIHTELEMFFIIQKNQWENAAILDGVLLPFSNHSDTIWLFEQVGLFLYSQLFFVGLLFTAVRYFPNKFFVIAATALNVLVVFIYFTETFGHFESLRDIYINDIFPIYNQAGIGHVLIHLIPIVFVALFLLLLQRAVLHFKGIDLMDKAISLSTHGFIVITVSLEIHYLFAFSSSPKWSTIAVSVWWGVYSLFLITRGIKGKMQYLRLAGMALFAITLLKLIYFDLLNLSTIAKTILFICLGALLLITSYLYNKNKASS